MSTTQALIDRMKAELKAAGLTYAALARELGMAASIKRSRAWRYRCHAWTRSAA
jgi:ribosomal protein L13E